ncbi:hypothetical protein MSG28_009174 [Choristoneura fumiferana]|uniref:Uncharacterized protein n=1 Tax=Choristoneura fumiferana TaxID=7141 RepID=A0ACC0KWM0_CHOFU|nr:hypothetical protein MSG28_009174 [Choristoneura fumiferana]
MNKHGEERTKKTCHGTTCGLGWRRSVVTTGFPRFRSVALRLRLVQIRDFAVRFLPPGSYIDARKHEPKELASIMAHIIKTPAAYHEFFRWKSLYTYHYNKYVCRLCAALNNQTMLETRTTYKEMRRWWNPDYKERCKDKTWGS